MVTTRDSMPPTSLMGPHRIRARRESVSVQDAYELAECLSLGETGLASADALQGEGAHVFAES